MFRVFSYFRRNKKHLTLFTTLGVGLYVIKRGPSSFTTNLPSEFNHRIYSEKKPIEAQDIPTRLDSLKKLKSGEELDVLVIGGGCTGSGIALDAATRGLKVALVEKEDYASGTSSRSTKLIHGGVRYLEKAFKNLDAGQLSLVIDALAERKHLLNIAPNLSYEMPILVPLYYKYPEFLFYLPYFWTGMKMYDFFAGSKGNLRSSYYMSKNQVLEKFPVLNSKGLKGAIVYYDGMHNDARMNLNIALTAAHKGALVTNHVELLRIVKDEKNKISGAVLQDKVTGGEFEVPCKSIINATGCFSDAIRKKDDSKAQNIISPSSGVHVVLSKDYSSSNFGMLIPHTDDSRVLFLLPWEGSTIAGTTDSSCDIRRDPRPSIKEVSQIMGELNKYINCDLKVQDVKSSWSGIRPLARDLKAKDTSSLSRDHEIEVSKSGLITISGGKWTTYRKMAQDTVDRLLKEFPSLASSNGKNKNSRPVCVTKDVPLVGSSGWSNSLESILLSHGLSKDTAAHLSHNYGYLAYKILEIAQDSDCKKVLVQNYPFLEAEVLFGVRYEHAMTAADVIARRMRLAFLDYSKAEEALPRVIELMAREKNWDVRKRSEEYLRTMRFLDTMDVQAEGRHEWVPREKDSEWVYNQVLTTLGKSPFNLKQVSNALKGGKMAKVEKERVFEFVSVLCGGGKNNEQTDLHKKICEEVMSRGRKSYSQKDLVLAASSVVNIANDR